MKKSYQQLTIEERETGLDGFVKQLAAQRIKAGGHGPKQNDLSK